MNVNQEASMAPPPYNEKIHETSPTGNSMIIPSGDHPMACNCPFCHQSIVTRVEKDNGLVVWLAAGGIFLLGCICGCCLIPFCIDALKDSTHYCPNCNRVIGHNKKL